MSIRKGLSAQSAPSLRESIYGIEKDIAKLADILGHSSINTTRIYIISTGDEHRKRMEHMRLII